MKFYNREEELKTFGNIKKDFRIAVTGRRRIGKTRLVEHFYKDKCLNFFVSAEKAEKEIISGWVREYADLHLPNVDNFKDFFDNVFFNLKEKVIFIDEIQNVLKVNKSFLFDLQRLIDKHKPKLIVSGSLISVMKKIIEKYKSPLYGRFDFIIKLRELSFKTIYEICKDFGLDIEKAFMLYSVFGGIPKYYELIEKLKEFKFEELVLESFIKYPRPLYEEVRTMLKEEFGKEYKTFFSILSAISQGRNKHSEIAGYLGKKETEITKYLSMLKEDYELIERITPIIGGKRGIYKIKNNIVSFWFNNVWRYNQFLETGRENKVVEFLRDNLNTHIARNFEKSIYELISSKFLLPFEFTNLGKQWGKIPNAEKDKNQYEIDIVALNENKKEILFCECKWHEKANAEEIIKNLSGKAKYVGWHNEERKESFAVFAKSFKKEISNYDGKKVYCFDLKNLSRILK